MHNVEIIFLPGGRCSICHCFTEKGSVCTTGEELQLAVKEVLCSSMSVEVFPVWAFISASGKSLAEMMEPMSFKLLTIMSMELLIESMFFSILA